MRKINKKANLLNASLLLGFVLFYTMLFILMTSYGKSVVNNPDYSLVDNELSTIQNTAVKTAGLGNVISYFVVGITNVPWWLNAVLGALFVFGVFMIIISLVG